MENYYPKKSIWKWIVLALIISLLAPIVWTLYFSYQKGWFNSPQSYQIQTQQNETAGWKTYRNDKYIFEFQYPKDIVVTKRNQNVVDIADTTDGYTINWSLKLYKNDSSQSLASWIRSEFNQFKDAKNKDCKIFKSDAYGPKVEIKNALTVLITQTSDFDESCADQGYYVISPNNLIIVKFEDVTQASPGHLQDIVSTFKFTPVK